jgi:DNA polymerase III subunit epsilon
VPLPLSQQPFVVVDVETTGGSPRFDRVIELAAVRVEGGRVTDRLQALVDPGTAVPPFVARLTGITGAMLRGRPTLRQLLPELQRLLHGAIVVSHNVSFDYAFLSSAFRRAGLALDGERLCTLRLARRLLPGLHSYRLDSLCAYLELPYVQQHRAGPDADATVLVLDHLLRRAEAHGLRTLAELLRLQDRPVARHRSRAGRVDEAQIAGLPTGPGVYLLKDAHGEVLYIGKSVNVRQRVRQHLRPSGTARSPAQPRLRKRLRQVAHVEAHETASELEALLLESKLVKRYLPAANSQLRDYRNYPFIRLDLREPHPRLVATRARPTDGADYFGPFRRAGTVASAVVFLSEQLGLRQCAGPLRPGQPACPLLEMGRCLGPCVGATTEAEYRAAAETAARVLRGEDRAPLERAAEQRDALAQQLRFEAAAELRDRIRDVEELAQQQRRLAACADRNAAVLVGPAGGPATRLYLIRHGSLAQAVTLAPPVDGAELGHLLRGAYASGSAPASVSRDEVDEMVILDAWLRKHRATVREVPISPADPVASLPSLLAAVSA